MSEDLMSIKFSSSKSLEPEIENWMILVMIFKFYVYSHNIYSITNRRF